MSEKPLLVLATPEVDVADPDWRAKRDLKNFWSGKLAIAGFAVDYYERNPRDPKATRRANHDIIAHMSGLVVVQSRGPKEVKFPVDQGMLTAMHQAYEQRPRCPIFMQDNRYTADLAEKMSDFGRRAWEIYAANTPQFTSAQDIREQLQAIYDGPNRP